MPRKGKMWKYFTVVNAEFKKAECNYCKKILSYKTTISNLKNHLKQKHLIIFEEISRLKEGEEICRDNARNENVDLNPRRSIAEQHNSERSDFLAVAESNADAMKVLAAATKLQAEAAKTQADALMLFAEAANKLCTILADNLQKQKEFD